MGEEDKVRVYTRGELEKDFRPYPLSFPLSVYGEGVRRYRPGTMVTK